MKQKFTFAEVKRLKKRSVALLKKKRAIEREANRIMRTISPELDRVDINPTRSKYLRALEAAYNPAYYVING